MPAFFATSPKGTEALLAAELTAMGVPPSKVHSGGVAFHGEIEAAYRVCLWARTASRVLMALDQFHAPDADALYAGVAAIDWSRHMSVGGTLAVDCVIHASNIDHSQFAALRVKDAVVDQFRDRLGERPSVDTADPDLRLNLYLHRNQARLSIDLSGMSLHRRGYRTEAGQAPMKENLAAALLLTAEWPGRGAAGQPLFDPMCGSGTLLIEGAWMAADRAPGLDRAFGFQRHPDHDAALWSRLREEARQRFEHGLERLPPVAGSDIDAAMVERARRNIERAGLAGRVEVERRALKTARPPRHDGAGLLIVNPPYGERMGRELDACYRQLGDLLRTQCMGWRAAVFTSDTRLLRRLRIRAEAQHDFHNGALECRLGLYAVRAENLVERRGKGAEHENGAAGIQLDAGVAEMLANRLRKNQAHFGRWARRNAVSCYRVYDADLPEFNAAIDIYQSEQCWAVVQEYEAPVEVEPALARARLDLILRAVESTLGITAARIVSKTRARQRDGGQYEKRAASGREIEVQEDGLRVLVNLADYLDTGLFLDHRLTRARLRELAHGRRMLNLFAYTAVASLHAAAGGASDTTSVDLSATYLSWARRNFERNGFPAHRHAFVRADCVEWLREQAAGEQRWGLIFLDPPTFSRSKRMEGVFDVQKDHADIIGNAMKLLEPDGVLVFSNNYRGFRLADELGSRFRCEDITRRTIPEDFRRNPRIHQCWEIRHRA